MKNIIYLSIVAVVFLCSCKGNSFLNQRYTHFAHSKDKQQHKIMAQPGRETVSQTVAQQIVPAGESMLASAEPKAAETTQAVQMTAGNNLAKATPLQKVKQALENPVKAAKAKTLFKSKKADASDAQSHKGLISGLIGLILYIVVSAVVIAAII